jgi:Ca2+-binding EF-hand superfamily protein
MDEMGDSTPAVVSEAELFEAIANLGVVLDTPQRESLLEILDPDHDGLIVWEDLKDHFKRTMSEAEAEVEQQQRQQQQQQQPQQ